MYSYIGKHKQNIFVINDTKIHIYNVKSKEKSEIEHSCKFVYCKNNVFIDAKKHMYIYEGTLKHVATLQKNISSLQKSDSIYFVDRFGDVYVIEDDKAKWLFGNMCFATSLCIGKYFYVGDKYGRVKKCTRNGKIIDYMFFDGPILDLQTVENKIFILQSNKLHIIEDDRKESIDIESGLKIVIEHSQLYILCQNSISVYSVLQGTKVTLAEECILDIVVIDDNICKLSSNGKVTYVDDLYDFESTYHTNHNLLTYKDYK